MRQAVRRPISICIVAPDIAEEPLSEHSATVLGIAQKFTALGDTVTVLRIPAVEQENKPEKAEKTEELRQHFFERYLINLVPLPFSMELLPGWGGHAKRSLAIYHYLREQDFDAVYFALERGLAYFSLLAKETGVYENPPQLFVLARSPTDWQSEADKFFLDSTEQVAAAYMEQYCAENCDGLVSTSQAILNWMQRKNWKIPAKSTAIPAVPPYEMKFPDGETARLDRKINEIVFLGGREYHKGLTLLCDALDKAVDELPSDLTITMLGPFGRILGEHTGGMLVRRARNWPFELKLLPRMSSRECATYLRSRRVLAVFPAYDSATNIWLSACVRAGVPLVATNVGSIPEFLAKESHDDCLSEPTSRSLAQLLIRAIAKGSATATPSKALEKSDESWERHLDLVSRNAGGNAETRPRRRGKLPLVSVVLVHHDRPQLLLQAVQSVEQQDYRNLELILVDDGSKLPKSLSVLDALEARFKKRGWKVLREENRYLGAARNTGVRAARGDYVVFLDDDNALFPTAVTKLVRAIGNSGADICTCFHKTFYGEKVPVSEKAGHIHYIILGAALDLGLLENTFGDATALVRREVFDKIGYQVELFGRTGEDWEFFARAALAGLKLRVVPEPLYWYRSNTQSMWRGSHWYDNRLPTLETFRKHGFKGLDHLYHLALSAHANRLEIESFRENLRFSPSDARFLQLCDLNPESEEAIELLAAIAASEGRADTAVGLLAQTQRSDSLASKVKLLDTESEIQKALAALDSGIPSETTLGYQDLRMFVASTLAPAKTEPLFYQEKNPDRLYLEATGQTSIATLKGGIPVSSVSVAITIALDQAIAEPTEFLVMAVPMNVDPAVALEQAGRSTGDGSGWNLLTLPHQSRRIELFLPAASTSPMNLVLAVRSASNGGAGSSIGCFSDISIRRFIGAETIKRPRTGAIPSQLRARECSREEFARARLATNYSSPLPLLLFPPEGGIFLRPSKTGPVAALLDEVFPPFAQRAIGYAEIAHDDASPFEFAMALTRPDLPADWRTETPGNCIAFSGWKMVREKFQLHEVVLENRQLARIPLDVNLAIRLPRGSEPAPANAYWRKLVFTWTQ